MRSITFASGASALLFLASLIEAKSGVHEHLEALHKRHRENRLRSVHESTESGLAQNDALEKRGGQCQFPSDAGLVAVTPGQQNAGWAMSPDQPCKPGNYCPYACPPGQVSVQWDPKATSYSYPLSMNGGLYCDNNGNIQKPFPDKPYCQSTASNIGVQNNAGGVVSFCQTVLPGNEAMLIPTAVNDYASLAVPDTSYWCGTAAHYYINPPGVGAGEACVWGTNKNPVGNWSPYVAGANVDASGQTFIKLGFNPIYLETTTPFRDEMPKWGVKIDCPNGGCNGLPCAIDPTKNRVNQMIGSATDGAGGAAFCVVTVSKGSTANFVVFNAGGDSNSHGKGSGKAGQFYQTGAGPDPTTNSTSTAAKTGTTSSNNSATTWSASNTTAYTSGPTGHYSNLFNSSVPSTTGHSGSAIATAATSLPSTGTASRYGMAAFGACIVAWLW